MVCGVGTWSQGPSTPSTRPAPYDACPCLQQAVGMKVPRGPGLCPGFRPCHCGHVFRGGCPRPQPARVLRTPGRASCLSRLCPVSSVPASASPSPGPRPLLSPGHPNPGQSGDQALSLAALPEPACSRHQSALQQAGEQHREEGCKAWPPPARPSTLLPSDGPGSPLLPPPQAPGQLVCVMAAFPGVLAAWLYKGESGSQSCGRAAAGRPGPRRRWWGHRGPCWSFIHSLITATVQCWGCKGERSQRKSKAQERQRFPSPDPTWGAEEVRGEQRGLRRREWTAPGQQRLRGARFSLWTLVRYLVPDPASGSSSRAWPAVSEA